MKKYFYIGSFFTSALIFSALRFLPLRDFPWFSRGYDFGFYLFELRHAASGSWFSSLAGLSGSYTSPLFLLNRLLNLEPAIFLLVLTIVCGLTMLLVWLYYFKENKQIAILAALLTAVSISYQEASYLALFKTLIALPIMLLAMAFIKNKRWWWAGGATIVLIALHRTSAIFFLISAAIYLLYFQIKIKKYSAIALELLGAGASAFFCWQLFAGQEIVKKIFSDYNPYVRGGIFFGAHNLWTVLWPFWILAAVSAFFYIKNKRHSLPVILAAVTVLWIIFQLPFYRRAVIYLDLASTIFVAYALSLWWRSCLIHQAHSPINGAATKKQKTKESNTDGSIIKYIFLMLIIAGLGFYTFRYLYHEPPLATTDQINEIKNFQTKNPGDFVLAVDANDAPWLLGYLKDSRLGAPGLFEDRSSHEEWNDFWYGQNQTQFLWKYPRPLYIYQNNYIIPGPIAGCFIPLTPHFSEYVCKN